MAGVNIVRVPFRGAGPAVLGLVGGQVQLMFGTASSVQPHLASRRLKPLAVTSARRSVLAPQLPTIAESGVSGYEAVTLFALFAPAATPAAIVNRLSSEIAQVVKQNEVKERFLAGGTEPVGSSPAELNAAIKADVARMSKVIKSVGIRAE
jgi:tripartite-type tricarboxylate transporter receptor subunit TctC